MLKDILFSSLDISIDKSQNMIVYIAVKHVGETLYGKSAISHGALEGKRVFCSDRKKQMRCGCPHCTNIYSTQEELI